MTRLTRWHPPNVISKPRVVSITERQADVLSGICHGHRNVEIAARLHVSEDTVKAHVKAVLRALDAVDRGQAAALACSGLVEIVVRDTNRWMRKGSA